MLDSIQNLRLKDLRKAAVAIATLAAQLLALNLIPENIEPYVIAGLATLNSIGVFAVRNGDKPRKAGLSD